jgi:hypothetical protein
MKETQWLSFATVEMLKNDNFMDENQASNISADLTEKLIKQSDNK